jgi:hypothetical protein
MASCEKEIIVPVEDCYTIVTGKLLLPSLNYNPNYVKYVTMDCTGSASFNADADLYSVGDTLPFRP